MPPLDAVLKSMNLIEKGSLQQPKLWNPSTQTDLWSQQTPRPVTFGSPETGRMFLNTPNLNNQDLFLNNYINKSDGMRDMNTVMRHATDVYQKSTSAPPPDVPESACKVYPPLLVRYNDPKNRNDMYVPVELYAGGEMHVTKSFPDMILNFHADTHAITVTTCKINAQKLKEYEIAMQTLYSMVTLGSSDTMLTLNEFTILYDSTRYALLRALNK
jgi:hypothetical protein